MVHPGRWDNDEKDVVIVQEMAFKELARRPMPDARNALDPF